MGDVEIERCEAKRGGGVVQFINSKTSVALIREVTIHQSKALTGDGGGILCTDEAPCSFHEEGHLQLIENQATQGTGGGLACTVGA